MIYLTHKLLNEYKVFSETTLKKAVENIVYLHNIVIAQVNNA